MIKLYYAFLFIIVINVNSLHSQWIQQVSTVTSGLLDCDFINQNTGWVCGDGGVILKTTNSGVNWLQQNSGVTKRLEGIEAVDANILYCVGWWQTILKSTNGGSTWLILREGSVGDQSFRKAFFLNPNTGWLLRSNYILRTTDGGVTFDSTHSIFTYLWDIYFKDLNTGVLCGDVALTMRTTDGGISWVQIPLPLYQFQGPNLYRLSFIGEMGWVIGEGGGPNEGRLVWRTTNFGITWDSISRVPYPINDLNYSVYFTNQNTGYCGGTTGYIFKTTNGGFNWIRQNSPSNGYRNDFWFSSDTLGWCVGGGGQIFMTTNGGTYVGVEPISNNIPVENKLYQNYPNPFNPVTNITYLIKKKNVYVKLIVYDMTGKELVKLVDKTQNSGIYNIDFRGDGLSSGIYLYSLSVNSTIIETKKMIIAK